jgi:hypothetical protein
MLEKTRKTPLRKKTPKSAATTASPNAALPPAPQAKNPALPPSPQAGGRVTQGSPAVAAGVASPEASVAPGQSAPRTPVTAEARWRMIAEAAYFKAQRRGFVGGDSKRDWAEAEAEIDAWLLESR